MKTPRSAKKAKTIPEPMTTEVVPTTEIVKSVPETSIVAPLHAQPERGDEVPCGDKTCILIGLCVCSSLAAKEAEQAIERAKAAEVEVVADNLVCPPVRVREAAPVAQPGPAEQVASAEQAPAPGAARDFVTVLQCLAPLRLTKKWRADGTIEPYDDAANFHLTEHKVGSFRGLVKLLDALAGRPDRALIRGKWAGETMPAAADKVKRSLHLFADTPHHWLMLDIDGFVPTTANPVTEPEAAVEEFITTQLPECFHGFSCRWQLSSSAGKPGSAHILKAHLLFWLITPYGSGALKAWKLVNSLAVDGALFNAVQLHFSAAPVFEAGVVDPVPVRSGVIEGFGDEVDLVIPEHLLAQVKVREHTGNDVELPDPTLKAGVVGAFCRAFTIDQCLETFGEILPYEFENEGDDRRINFLDGSGSPGGAFISDCRYYLSCKHNSDPFENRATNAFDLLRHYKFGDLDDPEDAFDESATSSTSYHRMVEWAKTLPEVIEQLAAMSTERAEAEIAMAADTGEEVLAQLRAMRPEEVDARWLDLALDLGPIAEDAVLEEVARVTRVNKRPLQQTLKAARQVREQAVREQALIDRANRATRARILLLPGDPVRYARQVERLIVDRAEITEKPESFVRFAGRLCEVVAETLPYAHAIDDADAPPPKTCIIRPLTQTAIEERIAGVAQLERVTESGPRVVDADPPMIKRILELHDTTAPTVNAVVTHPIVWREGEILAENGLHRESGLVLMNAAVEGCRPYSRTEAGAALGRLRETVFDGFEFATPLDADVALAMLFTGVQRRRLDQAPAFMILAASQSSGKTTLARCVHVILTGRDMPALGMPKEEAEIEKRLFATLSNSPAMLCFDNVSDGYFFHSPAIARALTSQSFEGRVLGESTMLVVPTHTLFTMTGNNLRQGRDEITRWATIRLAPKGPRPEERRFQHPDVVARMQRIRGAVLRDVVGIVSGYMKASDRVTTEQGTRYPAWDRQVRQALLWAGASDVADVFRRNAEDNTDAHAQALLLQALRDRANGRSFLAKDVRSWCWEGDIVADDNLIKEALEQRGREWQKTKSISAEFNMMLDRDTEIDGQSWRLTQVGKDRLGTVLWAVVRTD